MVESKDLTELTLKDLWREVKSEEDFFEELKEPMLTGLRVLTETAMDAELLEQLHASRYQRTEIRKGSRNGYRHRSLLTQYGYLQLKIPRDREGKYQPEFIRRYQQRTAEVDKLRSDVNSGHQTFHAANNPA